MKTLSPEWFANHCERLHHWRHDNLRQILEDLEQIQEEILDLLGQQQQTPHHITITASQEGNTAMSFAPGATITFTAVSDNAENVPVADTYTWSTTAGTVVPGADSTTVTISDAPLGDLTVTATDPAGLSGSVTVTVADQTPATVTVTAA